MVGFADPIIMLVYNLSVLTDRWRTIFGKRTYYRLLLGAIARLLSRRISREQTFIEDS